MGVDGLVHRFRYVLMDKLLLVFVNFGATFVPYVRVLMCLVRQVELVTVIQCVFGLLNLQESFCSTP